MRKKIGQSWHWRKWLRWTEGGRRLLALIQFHTSVQVVAIRQFSPCNSNLTKVVLSANWVDGALSASICTDFFIRLYCMNVDLSFLYSLHNIPIVLQPYAWSLCLNSPDGGIISHHSDTIPKSPMQHCQSVCFVLVLKLTHNVCDALQPVW